MDCPHCREGKLVEEELDTKDYMRDAEYHPTCLFDIELWSCDRCGCFHWTMTPNPCVDFDANKLAICTKAQERHLQQRYGAIMRITKHNRRT